MNVQSHIHNVGIYTFIMLHVDLCHECLECTANHCGVCTLHHIVQGKQTPIGHTPFTQYQESNSAWKYDASSMREGLQAKWPLKNSDTLRLGKVRIFQDY